MKTTNENNQNAREAAVTIFNAVNIDGDMAFYVVRCFLENKATQMTDREAFAAAKKLIMAFGIGENFAANIVRACLIEAADLRDDSGYNPCVSDSYRRGVADALFV